MSEILDMACEMARELHAVGAMDKVTLRMIEELRLPERRRFTADDVRRVRAKTRLSQPVFAIVMGVGRTTVAQWEQGLKSPSGPSARLLDVIDRKGIEAVA